MNIQRSSENIVASLAKDISKVVSNTGEKDDLVKHITELMKDLTLSLTSRQSTSFETMAKAFTANLELHESETRKAVSGEVDGIQSTVRDTANQLVPYKISEKTPQEDQI